MGNDSIAKYHISLLTANILFGVNYSFYSSIIGRIVTSDQLFMLRICSSAIFFVPFMFLSGKWRIDWKDLYKFALIGLIIVFGRIYLMLLGMNYTSPIDGSIIATMNPILIMIFSAILIKEKITGKRIFGILLGMAGALTLILSESKGGLHGGKMLGNILIMVSILFSALNTVYVKKFITKYHPFTLLGWSMLIGVAVAFPFFGKKLVEINTAGWNHEMWFELGYITIIGTVLATIMAYYPLKRVSATSASIYAYAQPVAATLLAVLRGQDKITTITIISAVMIFSGVMLVIFSYKNKNSAAKNGAAVQGQSGAIHPDIRN